MKKKTEDSAVEELLGVKGLEEIDKILLEDARRRLKYAGEYNPITGEGAPGDRVWLEIPDFAIPRQYVPRPMMQSKLVKLILKYGSISKFLAQHKFKNRPYTEIEVERELRRLRHKHDFLFWAYFCIRIEAKLGGRIRFKLNYAQLIVLQACEEMRRAGVPINLVIVKAR